MIDGSAATFLSRMQAQVLRATVLSPEREILIGIEAALKPSKRINPAQSPLDPLSADQI